jgi:UDP-glucose 4-epimerase
MSKIIALTGAAGYLGSVLIDYLRAQEWVERIIAIDVKPIPSDGRVLSYCTDVRDGSLLKAIFAEHGVTNVIHAAFIITPPRGMTASQMRSANFDSSKQVFHAAFETHTRQIVFISSCSVYGYHTANPQNMREDDELRPTMLYGHHKVAVEQHLNSEGRNYPATHIAIVRPVAIVGPRGQSLSPLRALTAQKIFILANGGAARTQAIHELDVTALIARLVETNLGGTFNAAPDDYATWNEIGKLSGLPNISLPRPFLNFATRFNTILPALHGFDRDVVDLFSESLVCDNTAARSQLGWVPRYRTKEAFAQLFGVPFKTHELSSVSE